MADYAALVGAPCAYCGAPAPSIIDRVDYKGGYEPSNCASSCMRCNAIKSGYESRMSPEQAIAKVRRKLDTTALKALIWGEHGLWGPWWFWHKDKDYCGPFRLKADALKACMELYLPTH